ncbi:MAG: hypothetical protein ACRD1L_09115 [Terriglobales bacterium]
MTVIEIEAALAEFLNSHPANLPFGAEVEAVQVLAGHKRQTTRKRRPTADRPSDKGDSLFIILRPARAKAAAPPSSPAQPRVPPENANEAQLADLLCALRLAERTPGHSFVALKWFRDTILPRQSQAWVKSPEARDRILREAEQRGWVTIEKIPNPRNPGFPTSTLRVAGSNAEVQRILGETPALGWGFTPIAIKGEPLSETVRRMRDEEYQED